MSTFAEIGEGLERAWDSIARAGGSFVREPRMP